MRGAFLFPVASAILAAAACVLPRARRHWADAMRAEMSNAESGYAAFRFALGCFSACVSDALSTLIHEPPVSAGRKRSPMPIGDFPIRPRLFAIGCAAAAVALGLVYLAVAGAPPRLMVVNATALVIGLAGLALVLAATRHVRISAGIVSLVLGAVLMGVSLFGPVVEGASRWVTVAGLAVQPSLIIVPVLLIYCARVRDGWTITGLMIAAIALALQPDRAMAGVMAAGIAALSFAARDAKLLVPLALAAGAFAFTLTQPDHLPAVPYVDQIAFTAFDVHVVAGLAVAAGLAWLVMPALAGLLADRTHGEAYIVFGAVWLAVVVAALLGNYPTPLVGYGASAIIGYAVSLAGLPARGAQTSRARSETLQEAGGAGSDVLRLHHA